MVTHMNRLGCDLSLNSSGIVLVSPANKLLRAELIKPSKAVMSLPAERRGPARRNEIGKAFTRLVGECVKQFGPLEATLEHLAHSKAAKNVKAAVTLVELAKWHGLAESLLYVLGIHNESIAVSHCRLWLCGQGNVDKEAVAHRIKVDYGIKFDGDPGFDLSDAALLALWANRKR